MTDAAINPLLAPPALPYGLPDYRSIRPEHYLPAFEAAFAEHRAEIEAIAGTDDEPSFENTVVAVERAGALLGRVSRTFYTVASAHGTEEIQRIEETLAPLMSAHGDAIRFDPRLYARIVALHDRIDDLDLT